MRFMDFLIGLKEKIILFWYSIPFIQHYYFNKWEEEVFKMEQNYEYIWGVRSHDDLSEAPIGLFSLNDFAIIYDKTLKKYFIEIETIYHFDNGRKGEINYLENILNRLEFWMIEKGYLPTDKNKRVEEIEKEINYYTIFQGWSACDKTPYDTILELYIHFKILVEGYKKICENNCKEE